MTDGQFNALIAVLGTGLAAIGIAIRWAASRIVKSQDASTTALVANTASNAILSTKIDNVTRWVETRATRPPLTRRQTAGGGVRIVANEDEGEES